MSEQGLSFLASHVRSFGSDDLFLELRPLPPKWDAAKALTKPYPRAWYPTTPRGAVAAWEFCKRYRDEWDMYFGVAARTHRGGGLRQDLAASSCLWCDIDGGEDGLDAARSLLDEAQMGKGAPPPHILICSGGGLHAYWRLPAPVSLTTEEERAAFHAVLKRLAGAVGGEKPGAHGCAVSAEPARILRVPGTYNHKEEGNPRRARIELINEVSPARPLEWWVDKLPAEKAPRRLFRDTAAQEPPPKDPLALPPATVRLVEQGAAPGGRHGVACKISFSAAKCGWSEDRIAELLYAMASGCGWKPDPGEVENLAQWACRNAF